MGVCADEGYRKTFLEFVKSLGKRCDISEKIIPKGWAIVPKRWRLERTFGWLRGLEDYQKIMKSAHLQRKIYL
ncbi:MAG: hypothetical protein FWC41_06160 [Firmicutes bacterium]|nr:hypothetical protein [Bacillota bacterium]